MKRDTPDQSLTSAVEEGAGKLRHLHTPATSQQPNWTGLEQRVYDRWRVDNNISLVTSVMIDKASRLFWSQTYPPNPTLIVAKGP